MQKLSSFSFWFLFLFSISLTTFARGGAYVGGNLHLTQADAPANMGTNPTPDFDSDTRFKLQAGYKFNPIAALEVAYTDWNIATKGMDLTLVDSTEVALKLLLPLTAKLDLETRFGIHRWHFDGKADNTLEQAMDGEGGFYGLGIRYRLTPAWDLGLSYQRYQSPMELGSLQLSANYYFMNDAKNRLISGLTDLWQRWYLQLSLNRFKRGVFENAVLRGHRGMAADIDNYARMATGQGISVQPKSVEEMTSYQFFLGYQLHDWLALEFGYIDFGEYEYQAGTLINNLGVPMVINQKLMASQMDAVLMGARVSLLKTPQGINLFSRLGVHHWKNDLYRYVLSTRQETNLQLSGIDLYYGVGLSWQFSQSFGASLEYTNYLQKADASPQLLAASEAIQVYSLGLEYKFGAKVRASRRSLKLMTARDALRGGTTEPTQKLSPACDERYRDLFFACENDQSQREENQVPNNAVKPKSAVK